LLVGFPGAGKTVSGPSQWYLTYDMRVHRRSSGENAYCT